MGERQPAVSARDCKPVSPKSAAVVYLSVLVCVVQRHRHVLLLLLLLVHNPFPVSMSASATVAVSLACAPCCLAMKQGGGNRSRACPASHQIYERHMGGSLQSALHNPAVGMASTRSSPSARVFEEFPHGRLVAVHLPGVTGQLALAEPLGEDRMIFDQLWRKTSRPVRHHGHHHHISTTRSAKRPRMPASSRA